MTTSRPVLWVQLKLEDMRVLPCHGHTRQYRKCLTFCVYTLNKKPWRFEQFSERQAFLSQPRRFLEIHVVRPDETANVTEMERTVRIVVLSLLFSASLVSWSQKVNWELASRRQSPRLHQLADDNAIHLNNAPSVCQRVSNIKLVMFWKINKHCFERVGRERDTAANEKLVALAAGRGSTLAGVYSRHIDCFVY